jgi:hypothetical protein
MDGGYISNGFSDTTNHAGSKGLGSEHFSHVIFSSLDCIYLLQVKTEQLNASLPILDFRSRNVLLVDSSIYASLQSFLFNRG